jgi:nucleotide-binding universal stress UspA family protein
MSTRPPPRKLEIAMTETDPSATPILVAYDGSEHARAAVTQTGRLFPGRSAAVVSAWRSVKEVVHASLIALPASVAQEAQIKMDAAARDAAQALADEGAELARAAGLDAHGEAIEATGALWPAIVRAADDHDAAVVVLGSRGRSAIRSAMLGSVSAGVVHHSRRPVMVVRAP